LPKDLPLLIISGDMDPVGDFGKGVKKVYNLYSNAGIVDVTLKLIPDARHELLNEVNKKEIYEILSGWIEKHLLQ
jgi:alpha-beta hydrolase superfamily lysophospholipase